LTKGIRQACRQKDIRKFHSIILKKSVALDRNITDQSEDVFGIELPNQYCHVVVRKS